MVPLLIGVGDPINRYPYLLIGVGDPINRGTFFIKLHFFGFYDWEKSNTH